MLCNSLIGSYTLGSCMHIWGKENTFHLEDDRGVHGRNKEAKRRASLELGRFEEYVLIAPTMKENYTNEWRFFLGKSLD